MVSFELYIPLWDYFISDCFHKYIKSYEKTQRLINKITCEDEYNEIKILQKEIKTVKYWNKNYKTNLCHREIEYQVNLMGDMEKNFQEEIKSMERRIKGCSAKNQKKQLAEAIKKMKA